MYKFRRDQGRPFEPVAAHLGTVHDVGRLRPRNTASFSGVVVSNEWRRRPASFTHYFPGLMDILRNPPNPERDAAIRARQDIAGRAGFILGITAAVAAVTIIVLRADEPFTFLSLTTAVLMAALNMPIGIVLGLFGERVTRPKSLRPPPRIRRPK